MLKDELLKAYQHELGVCEKRCEGLRYAISLIERDIEVSKRFEHE